MSTTPACLLYSGGADSTMAAYLTAQDHQPVHLLSYKHNHMSQTDKTCVNVRKLRAHFGDGAFIHHWIDMHSVWKSVRKRGTSRAHGRYNLFAFTLHPCLACKVAMHLLTAAYCVEQGIKCVTDGAHPSGAAKFPEQLEEGVAMVKSFYAQFGIDYSCPVYEIDRPDTALFEAGITEKQNTKDEHIYYTNQFACHIGLLAYVYYFATRPIDRSGARTARKSLDYIRSGLITDPVLDPSEGDAGDWIRRVSPTEDSRKLAS